MDKLKLFVGSSVTGLSYAQAVQKNLRFDVWVRVWTQGIFRTGSYPVDDLIKALDDNDFGAFIFLPEDVLIINGHGNGENMAVRDNVLFELGMFIGRLGRDRAFMIKPQGQNLRLPSDLAGVNLADFNDDPNRDSALGPAATDILERMKQAGPKTATGAAGSRPASPPGYDRAKALERAIGRAKPLIEGLKFIQSDIILPSGDVKSSERLECGQAISDRAVPAIPISLHSSAGRLLPPQVESLTEGQSVSLTWENAQTNDEIWRGTMDFSPPLTRDRTVSVKRERYMPNAISFTQRERLDVTNQTEREEDISVSFGQLYKEYQYQLVFPYGRFPERFRLDALLNDVRDEHESSFAERCITEFSATNTLMLSLPQPLPGYRYKVIWELPEDRSGQLGVVQAGFVDEMTRRLLGLRNVNHAHTEAVRGALSDVRKHFLPDGVAGGNAEVSLYVYDRQRSALACVASLDADIVEKQWSSYLFKPGRGVAGWAFRQRKLFAWCPAKPGHADEPDRYEPITEDERLNPPHAMIAFPLFYAENLARSVAVLNLATRARDSDLIALACDDARLEKLAAGLNGWYGSQLAEAVGVIASATFWKP